MVILDAGQSKLRSLVLWTVFSRLAARDSFKKWIIYANVDDLSRQKIAPLTPIETDFLRKFVWISSCLELA